MNDAPLAPDTASAASAATTSPSLRLLPLCPGGEGDGEVEGERVGLEAVSDRDVAVGNQGRPHLPPPSFSPAAPPHSLSAPLSLICCSQSASRRPENEIKQVMKNDIQNEMMKEKRLKRLSLQSTG